MQIPLPISKDRSRLGCNSHLPRQASERDERECYQLRVWVIDFIPVNHIRAIGNF